MTIRKAHRSKIADTLNALAGMMTAQGFTSDKIRPSYQTRLVAVPGAVVGPDGTSHVIGIVMVEFDAIPVAEFKPDAKAMQQYDTALAKLGFKSQATEIAPEAKPTTPTVMP